MNQIFDWMREQINAEIKECQDFYRAQNNDSVCKCVMQGNVNAYAKSLSLIDEAEAKWKSECCIRVVGKPFTSSCGQKYDKWTYVGEPYCAKCGKRIKIVEVE